LPRGEVTAENEFTIWCPLDGIFQVLISGLVTSVVTFQGSPDGGTTIYDIKTWSALSDNALKVGQVANTDWVYRIGVKNGGYGSDTITLRLEG
jgi:hypothetical protein